MKSLLASGEISSAFDFIDGDGERATSDLVELCEIEAPPFHEQARGDWFLRQFSTLGLSDVHRDVEGNVIGVRPGQTADSFVVLSAHLDTVFPPGTDCRVRRLNGKLHAPGVGDDGAGLAALLGVARTLDAARIRTTKPILFLATVGEEGEGDLRGARHFFTAGEYARRVSAFISLDGPGVERITHRALGSRRYRVTMTGPGGHSWGDFGIVNPIHTLGRSIANFTTYPVPLEPRTSFNVGRIEGGSSVNTIAEQASMSVDLRSVSTEELARVEQALIRAVQDAVQEENRFHMTSGTRIEARMDVIGDRPSGETPITSPLVRTVVEASRALGISPRLDCSSTDANIPISLGIPAVTIGAGGRSANTHCLTEWFDPTGREIGFKRVVLALCSLAGMDGKN